MPSVQDHIRTFYDPTRGLVWFTVLYAPGTLQIGLQFNLRHYHKTQALKPIEFDKVMLEILFNYSKVFTFPFICVSLTTINHLCRFTS